MRIAIFGKNLENEAVEHLQKMFNHLDDRNIEYVVYASFYSLLKKKITFKKEVGTFNNHLAIIDNISYLLSIGGDGTLLDTVSLVRGSTVPILGINTGRLGFLSNVSAEYAIDAINQILEKNYTLDQRTLLSADVNEGRLGDFCFGLNEISIHKKDNQAMINIHTYLDGVLLNSYWADGLIIATPTGSTAYSLSCGGPILLPESKSIVITPIAAHNLTVRPVVIPDSITIKLAVQSRNDSYLVNVDSKTTVVKSSAEITIVKASFKINLIKLNNQNFLDTIRNKLMWGVDKRN